jgi:acetylornithine deacetylase
MKGSIAVMLLLAAHFKDHPPPVDVWLTFVADEEDKSAGMAYLVEHWLPQLDPLPLAAVFLEPTEEQIGIAHKGFIWFEIEIAGKAAHGSRPDQGIDAILPLRAALSTLESINAELSTGLEDPLLGRASLHGGIIEGGTALSVIPARSRLRWERRTLPGETDADIRRELDSVVQAVDALPGDHRVTGKRLFFRPAYKIEEPSELVDRLKMSTPQSECIGLSFWADSALAGMAGIPSVLYGPAGHGAHAIDEWVSLKSMVRVYETITHLIEGWS